MNNIYPAITRKCNYLSLGERDGRGRVSFTQQSNADGNTRTILVNRENARKALGSQVDWHAWIVLNCSLMEHDVWTLGNTDFRMEFEVGEPTRACPLAWLRKQRVTRQLADLWRQSNGVHVTNHHFVNALFLQRWDIAAKGDAEDSEMKRQRKGERKEFLSCFG